MREFSSGATRDDDSGKPDPEGFLSPLALERYCAYMHTHRVQADGSLRDSDNWQKGMPVEAYRKSLVRHCFQLWGVWRGNEVRDDRGQVVEYEEALCAVIFNAFGLLHERLRDSASS